MRIIFTLLILICSTVIAHALVDSPVHYVDTVHTYSADMGTVGSSYDVKIRGWDQDWDGDMENFGSNILTSSDTSRPTGSFTKYSQHVFAETQYVESIRYKANGSWSSSNTGYITHYWTFTVDVYQEASWVNIVTETWTSGGGSPSADWSQTFEETYALNDSIDGVKMTVACSTSFNSSASLYDIQAYSGSGEGDYAIII